MRPNFPKSELLFCKSYHAARLGWFSFSFLTPAHESFHSHEQSFHSHQWVVGKQFHGFPPNPLPSGIVLHLDYSNCFESQGAFNLGPVEHTSLPHRSDVFLRVMDQQSSAANLSPKYEKQRTQNQNGDDLSLPIDYVIRILVI